jgi:hypothetical protein
MEKAKYTVQAGLSDKIYGDHEAHPDLFGYAPIRLEALMAFVN